MFSLKKHKSLLACKRHLTEGSNEGRAKTLNVSLASTLCNKNIFYGDSGR